MTDTESHAHRATWWHGWVGPVLFGLASAAAAYAAVAASLPEEPTAAQTRWALGGSSLTGLLGFLTAQLGTFAPVVRGWDRLVRRRDPPVGDTSAAPQPAEVFVSYIAADRTWAEWIRARIERSGHRVVLQTWNFEPDENLSARLQEALGATRWVVVVVSRAFLASPYAADEWTRTLRDASGGADRCLLVRVEQVTMPDHLTDERVFQSVDLVGLEEPAAAQTLLDALAIRGLKPPGPGRGAAQRPVDDLPPFPARGPLVTNLPPRNPNFTGRLDLLASMHESLTSSSRSGTLQACTLYGLGGVGKSQLAQEYAYRFGSCYDLIWWVEAEQPASMLNSLMALARALDLPPDEDQQRTLAGLWAALRQRDRWLLIFDNAESDAAVRPGWPPTSGGEVLVTSRNRSWGSVAQTIQVDPLAPAEAVAFLRKQTRSQDEHSAALVADRLGYLPLALEQAGAYVDAVGTSLEGYAKLIQETKDSLPPGVQPIDYPHTVETTWLVSMDQARQTPGAEQLLVLCSLLAPDDIPRTLLGAHPDLYPEPLRTAAGDRQRLEEAIGALGRYSLLSVGPDELAIHRLVQQVVHDRLGLEATSSWAVVAVRLVERAFPVAVDDPATWSAAASLLPHAVVVTEHAMSHDVAVDATRSLLKRAARYSHRRAGYRQALRLYKLALKMSTRADGEHSLDAAEALQCMGQVLYHVADLPAAEAATMRALRIRTGLLGGEDLLVAETLTLLARIRREHFDLEAAIRATDRALQIRRSVLGEDDLRTVESNYNRGILLWRLGRLQEAQAEHERVLEARTAALGEDHPDVAISHKHLGMVLRDLGQLQAARRHLERSVDLLNAHYGPDNPDTIDAVSHLADVLRRLGEVDRAERLLRKVIAKREAQLGPDHPDVAGALNMLGAALRQRGELEEAQATLERALRSYEATYGPDHPYVADTLGQLGPVLCDQGELDQARSALERALGINPTTYGPDHPSVARTLVERAAVLREQGDPDAASADEERAAAIMDRFGEQPPRS
jgi:tetratricopeptide (TPR) repeat protein